MDAELFDALYEEAQEKPKEERFGHFIGHMTAEDIRSFPPEQYGRTLALLDQAADVWTHENCPADYAEKLSRLEQAARTGDPAAEEEHREALAKLQGASREYVFRKNAVGIAKLYTGFDMPEAMAEEAKASAKEMVFSLLMSKEEVPGIPGENTVSALGGRWGGLSFEQKKNGLSKIAEILIRKYGIKNTDVVFEPTAGMEDGAASVTRKGADGYVLSISGNPEHINSLTFEEAVHDIAHEITHLRQYQGQFAEYDGMLQRNFSYYAGFDVNEFRRQGNVMENLPYARQPVEAQAFLTGDYAKGYVAALAELGREQEKTPARFQFHLPAWNRDGGRA